MAVAQDLLDQVPGPFDGLRRGQQARYELAPQPTTPTLCIDDHTPCPPERLSCLYHSLFKALFDHCDRHLPHFMVPRYYRIVPEMLRTPTGKIQKVVLRNEGRPVETWDSAAAGLRPTRDL
ncbi:hypothetical protein [Saccharopolyspora phatthalungensis]|uniref:AMP-binding enzyme C-terminal domain-containing protein n=1 Tax=Saccharopolyspora phatthalungensis TaxID=664693 RepID=A0A840PTA5_9PSEU|nr:hypothetical protein [Saccharopolyspora phatthalungensis]MBB5153522.1 hypothetical protein [Saccharopolyspora phatthalungensis]